MSPEVTIVLLTKNAGPEFGRYLDRILAQQAPFSFEVLAIDSGSTDGTLEVLNSRPITLHQIAPDEFGFGRTKNFALTLASGRYLVFLSQDAEPASANWLAHLISGFRNQMVA